MKSATSAKSARAPRSVTPASGLKGALVTGSALRLGREIALRLAASGRFTFVHYRGSKRAAEAVLKTIRAAGGDGALVTGDLGAAAGVASIVRAVKSALGPRGTLDVLVNNVGVYKTGPLLRFSPDDFDAVLRANLTGAYRLIHALLPLVPRKGNIVNIGYAGVDNLTGSTHNTAYLISKTGLLILTKSLAQALGPRGVRVNMVSPGILSNSVELPEKPSDFVPLGVLGEVGDVADAVEFIVGPKARYVTGINLDVAGGYHLGLRSLESNTPRKASRNLPRRKPSKT
jgi:3-oxoacyl-[acyl-carrier protein] reductase